MNEGVKYIVNAYGTDYLRTTSGLFTSSSMKLCLRRRAGNNHNLSPVKLVNCFVVQIEVCLDDIMRRKSEPLLEGDVLELVYRSRVKKEISQQA
jgi:hypothetical protein